MSNMGTPIAMSRALLSRDTASPNVRPDAEQRRENRIGGFLHAQRVGDEGGGAARRADHALDGHHRGEADARTHQAKGDESSDRGGNPPGQMQCRG